MKHNLEFALHTAIMIEKQSFDFYRYAARMVSDERTRQVFKLLAADEADHMRSFHMFYQEREFGELHRLVNLPPDLDMPAYRALLDSVDTGTREREALEISLREEEGCIELYSELAGSFKEPEVRELFVQALSETRTHYKIIRAEYMRFTGMAGASDTDRNVPEPTEMVIIDQITEDSLPAGRLTGEGQRLLAAPADATARPDGDELHGIGRKGG